jgi:hypothetical protein
MSQFELYLTAEQKMNILSARVQQHAGEGYQHEINLAIAKENGDETLLESSKKAISIISSAISVELQQLSVVQNEIDDKTEPVTDEF